MGFAVHTVDIGTGSNLSKLDRVGILLKKQVANVAGGGAGAAVTVAITGNIPTSCAIFIGGFSQDATYYISNRTSAGFTVNILPRLAANTLAIGTFDLMVVS